jgi:hypothetical protein
MTTNDYNDNDNKEERGKKKKIPINNLSIFLERGVLLAIKDVSRQACHVITQ